MVVLGLGSNLGDRTATLRAAQRLIEERGLLTRLRRSTVVETPALLPPDSPASWNLPFLNLALVGECGRSPRELLGALKEIERELGRADRGRWAPREIDIDILAWDDRVVSEDGLAIPHPGLLDRAFALQPLAELQCGWLYPVAGPGHGQTAATLARRFGTEPKLVGVVNITPDSFSDGGQHLDPAAAVAGARALAAAGARVLDLGAESTRPGASPLSAGEEWKRLEPVLAELATGAGLNGALLSVDTRHAETARRAIALGVSWINDVGGLGEREMRAAMVEAAVDVVVMHSLTVPADRNVTLAPDADPVEAVLAWGEAKLRELESCGIARARVIVDPGIGFGKTPEQSLALLRGAARLSELGARVLVGHSRKSFFSLFTGRDFADRDVETLTMSILLAQAGVSYLRVHNIDWHARAFRVLA